MTVLCLFVEYCLLSIVIALVITAYTGGDR